MFKMFEIYIYEHREPVLSRCIPLRIYKSRLFQFSPRLFGSPNVHLILSSLSREVLSCPGSTVGPGFIVGFITMKPKISLYAYGQVNFFLSIKLASLRLEHYTRECKF